MKFIINVEVERESGKFVGRDEIAEKLIEEIGQIVLDGMGADGESVYNIVEVEDQ